MIDSKYRDPYQNFIINPLLKSQWINRSNPTIITLMGLLLGILAAIAIPFFPLLALILLLLSGFFDTLDGSLARHLHQSSNLGAVFDITSDRIVEFGIILGLYFISPAARALPCLLMLGSVLICVTTFLVVGIFTENKSEKGFFYSPGIMERTEAFAFFALMIAFPSLFTVFSLIFSFLVSLTGAIRVYQFMKL